jgi:putative DNA primase/helicase
VTAAELKALLPLPELMARCGDGERAKKKVRCPFHDDHTPSFSVYQRGGLWFWKCHAGCGEGDELDYLKRKFGLGDTEAFAKWRELAGVNGGRPAVSRRDHLQRDPKAAASVTMPEPDLSAEWQQCVAAFTDEHAAKLPTWRGYSSEFVAWLRQRQLVGLDNERFALPIHNDAGAVVGFHCRESDGTWRVEGGCRMHPLVIGDTKTADVIFAFESQWDGFAVLDKLAWHRAALLGVGVIVTRGASNGGKLCGLLKRDATVYAFRQNDAAAEKWIADVTAAATADGAKVKLVATPAPHKDPNDWTKAGATGNDLNAAMETAMDMKPAEQPRADGNGETAAKIESALVSTVELAAMELTPREFVLRPFLKAGDLGFIYAKRGDGKTWLAMLIAKAIATGTSAGPWTTDKPWTALYVDGEMPAEESKRRIVALGGAGENLLWLHHEIYFERTGRTLNLADAATQQELTALMQARGVRVLVLDNLSCLFSGVKENDADSWEQVLPWLLQLRRLKIAVVIVAHAGRSGQTIRGTSRREDAAFWVLKLERQDTDDPQFRGIRFASLFTKNRNALEDDCPPLEWTFTSEQDDRTTVTAKPISGVELLVSWVRSGLDSATDIAAEMEISKGQVSKLAKRAERLGKIVIDGRHYRATSEGPA